MAITRLALAELHVKVSRGYAAQSSPAAAASHVPRAVELGSRTGYSRNGSPWSGSQDVRLGPSS